MRFYDAIFTQGLSALGDAVGDAKISYHLTGYPKSLLYSFVLQGDPAMNLMRPDIAVDATAHQSEAAPGSSIAFSFTLRNNGVLPVAPIAVIDLTSDLIFEQLTGPVTVVQNGAVVTVTHAAPLGLNEVVQFTLSAQIEPSFGGNVVGVLASANSPSSDFAPANNVASASTNVIQPGGNWSLFLPALRRH